MNWSEINEAIRTDLMSRGLNEPWLRLRALDLLEKLLSQCYTSFVSNPIILLDVGKDAVSAELARLKSTGNLNGAEKSVLNEIFTLLRGPALHPSGGGMRRKHRKTDVASQRLPTSNAVQEVSKAKVGLPPVISERSKILILGTLPGDDSLRLQQYYAHSHNQFWKILAEVYCDDIGEDYPQRLEFLHRRGLALWDVLRSAEREGSSDSHIKNEVANNFTDLCYTYVGLRTIVFNGSKAQSLFRRHVVKSQSGVASLTKVFLPSTSPTPGQHVPPYEEKVVCWKILDTL